MSAHPATAASAVQVNLFCDDVEQVARFYTALGFPVVFTAPPDGAPEHIEVEAAGTRIGLTSVEAANRIAGLGVAVPTTTSAEVVFWCEDTDRMFRTALEAGAAEITVPMDSPDGRIRYGWVRDPAGHQIKFVALR